MRIIGIILPDLFSLILLSLSVKGFSINAEKRIVEKVLSENDISVDSKREWIIIDEIASRMRKNIFVNSFYIPGLVSIVAYCGLMIEKDFQNWMPLAIFGIVVLLALDFFIVLSNTKRRIYQKHSHFVVVTSLIIICVIGKIFG